MYTADEEIAAAALALRIRTMMSSGLDKGEGKVMDINMEHDVGTGQVLGGSGYSPDSTKVTISSANGGEDATAVAEICTDKRSVFFGSVVSITVTHFGRGYPVKKRIEVTITSTSGGQGAKAYAWVRKGGWKGIVRDSKDIPAQLQCCTADATAAVLADLHLTEAAAAVWNPEYEHNLLPPPEGGGVSIHQVLALLQDQRVTAVYTEFEVGQDLTAVVQCAGHFVVSLQLTYEDSVNSQVHCVGFVVQSLPDESFTARLLDHDRGINSGFSEKLLDKGDMESHVAMLSTLDATIRTLNMHPVEIVQIGLPSPSHNPKTRASDSLCKPQYGGGSHHVDRRERDREGELKRGRDQELDVARGGGGRRGGGWDKQVEHSARNWDGGRSSKLESPRRDSRDRNDRSNNTNRNEVCEDLGYHIQMRDLHHARGSASGHYNDRGSRSGGGEERGGERDG